MSTIEQAGFSLGSTGIVLPQVGFGTWAIPEGKECVRAVAQAIVCGYRLIDGAAFYKNEHSVGQGVRLAMQKANLNRKDIFVTSKVWPTNLGYQKTMDAFFKTLNDTGLDYLDLYLIHWPANAASFENWEELNVDTWRAMQELYGEGYVQAIGVSNFKEHHLRALLNADVPPMVNQLEIHPGHSQKALVDFCHDHGMVVEGWSPFGRGAVLDNELITALAQKYERSPAQICLRFAAQLGVLPIPKSSNTERMRANLKINDFELSTEDMETLLVLDEQQLGYSGEDSDLIVHHD